MGDECFRSHITSPIASLWLDDESLFLIDPVVIAIEKSEHR
jgi:hypothetical protein